MEERKAFTMLRSYYEAAKTIPDQATQAKFLMAILSYGFDDEEPELTGWAASMFALVKPNIDANKKRTGRSTQESESDHEVTSKSLLSHTEVTPKSPHHNENEYENDKGQGIKDIPPKSPPEGAESDAQEQAFDAFWAAYPKKKSKGQAKRAWSKLNPSSELIAAIMDKLQQLKASEEWQREGGKYIPYPSTWLNAEGWEDEIAAPQSEERQPETYFTDLGGDW